MFWYPQVILLAGLCEYLSEGHFLRGFPLIFIVLITLVLQAVHFYAVFMSYGKSGAGLRNTGLLDLTLLVFAGIPGTGISIAWSHNQHVSVLVIIGVCSTLLAIALFFRWRGRNVWQDVDFLPVTS